ncbi:hypothetical protein [Rhizobium sp. BK176]|uniref:hypothetical protein n=1 Tax=Rhizobium sp. BK176 TaxID=2587071 RepID=UPI00216A7885|nr:hypothetical protein [Rhizobium sp. BK176]MCS4089079.1 hypothetical protein [Rhizobium sp. BK176]
MTLSSFLSSLRRHLTPTDPDLCRFRETVVVASLERSRLEEALDAMAWNYGQLVKGKELYNAYGSEPPLVVVDHRDRAIVFSAPTGLKDDIFHFQMRDCVEAMHDAAVPFSDATFLLSFGAGHDMQLVEVLSMTGERDENRPALALSLTAWAADKPPALNTFVTSGTVWRPPFGLSYKTYGRSVCLHGCADDMASAAAFVENEAVALVEGEYGRLRPLGDHPANSIVLNLADGCAYDMLGGMAVPVNKLAERAAPALS